MPMRRIDRVISGGCSTYVAAADSRPAAPNPSGQSTSREITAASDVMRCDAIPLAHDASWLDHTPGPEQEAEHMHIGIYASRSMYVCHACMMDMVVYMIVCMVRGRMVQLHRSVMMSYAWATYIWSCACLLASPV